MFDSRGRLNVIITSDAASAALLRKHNAHEVFLDENGSLQRRLNATVYPRRYLLDDNKRVAMAESGEMKVDEQNGFDAL